MSFRYCFWLLLVLPASLHAGVASPVPVSVHQPDGTTFSALIRGDEHSRWVENLNGFTVAKADSGRWEYVSGRQLGKWVLSGVPAHHRPPAGLAKHQQPESSAHSKRLAHGTMYGKAASEWQPSLVSGPRRLLFIAVNFSDRQLVTTPASWDNAIFDATPGAKSVVNHYLENSFGLLQPEPAPHNQSNWGVVEVSLNSRHPNTGLANLPSNRAYRTETGWVNEALAAATQFVDFAALDSDGNGDLTLDEAVVYFIVAGYDASGSANEPNVWAHKWGTWNSGDVLAGNVEVNQWAINGELYDSGDQHAIGVITHELGHLMCGLPDLYDINGENQGMGIYSLMAAGSWGTSTSDVLPGGTPTNLDAWSRYLLGWSQPRLPGDGENLSFGTPTADRTSPALLRDGSSDEYWLVENRPPVGWDLGMEYALRSADTQLIGPSGTVPSRPLTYTAEGTVVGVAVDCGLGKVGEFPAAVAGNIALISRGDNLYREKVSNAMAAGALAAIIYNNTAGITDGTLGLPGQWIPTLGIDQADGPPLAGQTVSLDVTRADWSGGLLVQHVDISVGSRNSNNINSSTNGHQGIVVEEASTSAGSTLENGAAISGHVSHLFYAGNQSSWGPGTSPSSSNYYNGSPSGFALSSVSTQGADMNAIFTTPGGTGATPPTAGFTYTTDGLSVSFSDTSTDDGVIVGYSWDFGDGNSSTSQNPGHSYSSGGAYTVTLSVTDDQGLSDSSSTVVSVNGPGGTEVLQGSVRPGKTSDQSLSLSGGIVQLSLTWSNSDDLDLVLLNPSGVQVAGASSSDPIEQLSYDTGNQAGTYTARIINQASRKGKATNYTLTVTHP